jgi:multiple sugar transport system substrate-binding protein
MTVGGTIYGIPDDGDYHMLYYRKDIFEDADTQAEFMEAYGYELVPPETFEQFNEICAFISEKYAPETYGCAIQRVGQTDAWFMSVYRGLGGRFFDTETMEAQINGEIGVQAASLLAESLEYGPPAQAEMDFVQVFSAFVSGDAAMVISWPPVGRWSQGVGVDDEGLAWLPETQIAGNIGYAPQPGGGELAAGMTLTISSDSQNKEAAYLFAQWMNSQSVSLGRVISPTGLRDPFRESHYTSEEYLATWDNADEYLGALKAGQLEGYLDLSIPGSREFQVALDQAMTTIYAGGDIQAALDQAAADWNAINEEKGIDSQRAAYEDWAARPNAYGE